MVSVGELMLSYFLSLFDSRPNSVSDIVSGLEDTVRRLEDFRDMANNRIDEINAEMAQLEAEEDRLETESVRALAVASKLRDLIS
jgi:hypothetical protein